MRWWLMTPRYRTNNISRSRSEGSKVSTQTVNAMACSQTSWTFQLSANPRHWTVARSRPWRGVRGGIESRSQLISQQWSLNVHLQKLHFRPTCIHPKLSCCWLSRRLSMDARRLEVKFRSAVEVLFNFTDFSSREVRFGRTRMLPSPRMQQ